MSTERPRVLYWSHATPAVYAMIAEVAGDAVELLTLETGSAEERAARLAEADIVICAATPLPGDAIRGTSRLKLVHHQGVGYHDTVDVPALAEKGIRLALTPQGTTTGVAEHTVLLMLAVCKRLAWADAELRAGRWHVNALRPESREISGMTIGYVGFGRIGQAVARRLAAFETRGLYHDPVVALTPAEAAALGVRRAALDEVLATADVVTLHVPLTAATRHLIDRAAIERMKPGAILINASRGHLVDEAALAEALESGRLGGAGLDCFADEPPAVGSPLLGMRSVIVTPHIAAGTRDAFRTKMRALFDNIARYVRGEPLQNEVELSRTASG